MPASSSGRKRHRERAILAYRLRHIEGLQMLDVAQRLEVSREHAHRLVREGVALCVTAELRHEAREGALSELEALRTLAYSHMNANYPVVQMGHIVCDDNGDPFRDIGPNLQAMDRILRIEKRRSEIFAYDAPRRQAVSVVSEDVWAAELRRLEAEVAVLEAAEELPPPDS